MKRYGFAADKHAAYIEKILNRVENPCLNDDVERVARQPLRKLNAGDRLIKPILGTLESPLPNDNLVTGMAAARHYRREQDPQALELAARLASQSVATTLAPRWCCRLPRSFRSLVCSRFSKSNPVFPSLPRFRVSFAVMNQFNG